MMDFLNTKVYEHETIRLALAGDHEAGVDALRICRAGLYAGKLSASMAHYLASRLDDVLEGIKPDRALCIAKPASKPPNPLPEWQQELGAVAALLVQRGYKAAQITKIMSEARTAVHRRGLDKREAYRIMKDWSDMRQMQTENLVGYVGPYGEILKQYLPLNQVQKVRNTA